MKKITLPTEGSYQFNIHPVLTIGDMETVSVSTRLLPTVCMKVTRSGWIPLNDR